MTSQVENVFAPDLATLRREGGGGWIDRYVDGRVKTGYFFFTEKKRIPASVSARVEVTTVSSLFLFFRCLTHELTQFFVLKKCVRMQETLTI